MKLDLRLDFSLGTKMKAWRTPSGSTNYATFLRRSRRRWPKRAGDMVRKPAQQEAEYVDRLAVVTDWLGIPVEQYPAWTVAVLERELTLMNKLVRPFRDRGDEKAVTLLMQKSMCVAPI